jgi:hypothetical protein
LPSCTVRAPLSHGATEAYRAPARPDGGLPRRCLRRGAAEPAREGQARPEDHKHPRQGRLLACAFCRRPITTDGARIEVGGAHSHSFSNPEGVRFRIGCFADAFGLAPVGARSRYWTWFPGFSWQVELCGGCGEQLGWLYRSADSAFHGLILDRLIEKDAD